MDLHKGFLLPGLFCMHLELKFKLWQCCFCLEPLLVGARFHGHLRQHVLEQFYDIL